ncbi:MAG: hypothetical protein C0497_14365 [Gemmatimonas sp.]|nr:hypothetical protein [Gemmatimonas sp.]
MNFSRKTILVAGAALLAACGDQVRVTEYPPTPPVAKVNFVEVTPATATLTVNQSMPFTAAVNADAGLATTVTWSASAGTITTAGVFTAPATANPGIAVCATSTVDTGKKGCATVVVSPVTPTIPATVSIEKITGAGGLGIPVNPAAVAGQIDVTLNINPGNQTISKVELLVGGAVAGSQTFTAAGSAALRYEAEKAIAAQTTFPQVVFSVNTAAFNATTGAPTYLNGTQAVQAKVYTTTSGSTSAASASVSQNLTFANANAFASTTTVGGTTAAENNGAGYRFNKGDVSVSIIPVSYTGVALASATVNFGAAACDNSGTAQRSKALTAPATGAFAWTASWANSGAAAAGNLTNYEFNEVVCAGSLATGERVSIQAAQDASGNPFTTTALPLNVGTGFRMDNRAPNAAAAFTAANTVLNPNGRALSWLNDAAAFTTVTAAGNDGMIAAAVLDGAAGVGGIGTVTYAAKVGTTLATATAAADITNPTTLAASATNATYCLVQYAQDKLGNRTPNPAACLQTFGVDRAAPTIAYAAGITANSRFNAAPALEFNVTVSDTGLVGNSGMLPAVPAKGNVIFRGNGNTATQACFVGAIVSSVCTQVGLAGAAPVYGTTTMAATPGNTVATEGYYTFAATAFDAAGNSATLASRTTLVDATAPGVGAASAPLTVAAGWTASAFLNENLDLQSQWFSGAYAGAPAPLAPAVLGQAQTALNGYNAATFINTNYAVSQVINLPFAIQANAAAGLTALSGVSANAMNQANTVTTGAGTLPTFTAPTAIATGGATGMTGFTVPAFGAGITGVSSGLSTAATAARPASIALTTTTTGPTGVFNNPFARVDFYGLNVAGTEWRLLGSTTASALTDIGAVRTFTYSLSINGASAFSLLGGTAATITQNVIAIGYNSTGTVGMVSAAALALPIVF